jgi:glutaconate CoA-transferase subunit A
MPGEYFSDEDHLRRWLEVEKEIDGFKRFLDEFIFGVADFGAYLNKCGGLPRMQELRRQELLL